MTKEVVKLEFYKILDELNEKKDIIIAEAKKNGTWLMGLDSNNYLFVDVDNEAKEKIRLLINQIDE